MSPSWPSLAPATLGPATVDRAGSVYRTILVSHRPPSQPAGQLQLYTFTLASGTVHVPPRWQGEILHGLYMQEPSSGAGISKLANGLKLSAVNSVQPSMRSMVHLVPMRGAAPVLSLL